jgi:hypothetical protein
VFTTDYRGVAELGLIAGAGVLISLASSLTLLPALLSLGAAERPRFQAASLAAVAKLRHVPITYSRPIRWAALALGLFAASLVPRATFDHRESVNTNRCSPDLLAGSASPWTVDWACRSPAAQALAAARERPWSKDARWRFRARAGRSARCSTR